MKNIQSSYKSKNSKNRGSVKKSAGVLALAIILVLAFATTVFAINTDYTTQQEIGRGTTYYAVDGENSSGLQKAKYVEYTPNTSVSPVIAYGKGFYGRSTINYVATYLESLGQEVIAGINADFFDLTTGVPIGMVVKDGVFISSNVGQAAVGFKADGTAVLGKPTSAMTLSGASGSVVVECFNKTRSTYTVCLYDSDFAAETKIKSMGYNIVFERLDATPVTINSQVKMKVVSKENVATSTPIGENQMVLSVSEKGPLTRIPNFQIGEEVTFSVATADQNWADVVYAVGGKTLINNGVVDASGSPGGLAARSSVGVKADGTVVLYEVDGKQSGYSVGLSPTALAAEMQALGCVNAINLDGGGSSAMVIQSPGEKDSVLVNRPSDGSPRTCANYIFLVNNTRATGNVKNLHIYPETNYILTGASVKLNVKATDENFFPAVVPTDLSYTVANSMGSVADGVFTAGSKTGTANLSVSGSGATGNGKLFVLSAIDGLSLTKANSSTAISSLTVAAGEKVGLSAKGTYKGQNVAASAKSLKWSVSGNIGKINENGEFIADGGGSTGKITATYGGISKSIEVKVTVGEAQSQSVLADFESSQPFSSDNAVLAVTKEFDKVARGMAALKVNYNFDKVGDTSLVCTPVYVNGSTYIHLYGLSDDSGATLTANFTDASGAVLTAQLSPALGGSYAISSAEIPTGSTNFIGFTLSKGTKVAGNIYLDNVVLATSSVADTLYPTITFTSSPTEVAAGAIANYTAKITDDNGKYNLADSQIKVAIDGKNAAFTSNKTTGNIAFGTGKLTSGLHRISVTVMDNFGNLTKKSVDVVAKGKTEATSTFSDVDKHWAKNHIDFVAKQGLLKGEVDKKGNTKFFPKRNLTRAEFAVIIARYLNLEADKDGALPFADSAAIPTWAVDSVKAVYEAGIMTGSQVNGKSFFYPKDNIVRQEVMTVIDKALPRGYKTTAGNFTDGANIPAWALPHINYLVSLGIVNGYEDGKILPKENITRAEIAKILYNLF